MRKYKYKIGDKVRVRKEEDLRLFYGHRIEPSMLELAGKIVSIYATETQPNDPNVYYYISEDDDCCRWTEEFFEDIPINIKLKFGGYVNENLYIERVLYKKPVTVTFWSDGTKTVSKSQCGDEYSPAVGLLLNYLKKNVGGEMTNKLICDWLPDCFAGEYKDITLKDVRKKHHTKSNQEK